jgi:hypothetical protein
MKILDEYKLIKDEDLIDKNEADVDVYKEVFADEHDTDEYNANKYDADEWYKPEIKKAKLIDYVPLDMKIKSVTFI